MKTVDKKEVINRESAEFIKQAEEGKFVNLVPDTFIIKTENGGQGYAIRHLNRQDMILIDTIGKGAQQGVKQLVEEGYKIKAILVTHKSAIDNSYAPLKTISEDAGGAPIYTHPINNKNEEYEVKDINGKNNIFGNFSLSVRDFPAESGEAVVIHSEINEGMCFAGCSALGAPYDSEEEGFRLPDLKSENKKFGLAESWRSYMREFSFFFPYKGKPGFNLSEGQQKDVVLKLGTKVSPGGGNLNM